MNTPMDHTTLEAQLRALTTRTLSPAARYAHVGVLLLATIMSALLTALLLTEPALPGRTQAAFGTMLAVGVAWVGYAAWVLTSRRTLLAHQSVVAGWIAVVVTGLFLLGSVIAVLIHGSLMAITAAVMAGCMELLAVAVLMRARVRARELLAQRDALEADIVRER